MARFFYTPKPRQFDYKPRYYDPEKEAREQRRRELLGDRPAEGEEYVPGELLRQRRMQRMMDAESRRRRKRPVSVLFLILLLALLVLAVMWVVR